LNWSFSRLRDSREASLDNQIGFGMDTVKKYMGGIVGTGLLTIK
jgi:hypothetical protein